MSEFTFTADVTVLVDRNATVAKVDLFDDNDLTGPVATATGSAKRDFSDKHDEDIAVGLAVGRAFESLGRKFTRLANKRVKEADRKATEKAARKARRALLGGPVNNFQTDNVNDETDRIRAWVRQAFTYGNVYTPDETER